MQTTERSDETTGTSGSEGFPIVGVGASAGGLEAFQELLSTMRPTHEFALLLVQHLDPDRDSLLKELLGKRAQVPVDTITDGMVVEKGRVYLIPPASGLSLEGYTLRLTDFDQPRGVRRPIDRFFESLAEQHGSNCVGVVLSGTGSDGAAGLRAIKQAGGLVLVQDPKQAKYDSMPTSAIEVGGCDLVLPSADIVGVVDEYFSHHTTLESEMGRDEEFIARVAKHLFYRTGHDFSHYKIATFERRVARRMSVLSLTRPTEYLQRLISDEEEATRLFKDMLINVTEFFRDRSAFETLASEAIQSILRDKGRDEEVRIWVPGCSTGQEAYTIGMLCLNELARTDGKPNINIFASDIDEDALQVARDGIYPVTIADEMPPDALERHFKATNDGYEVGKDLRDIVRFSRHSFIKDPPFSKLDLISCRNVLIYFDKWLQGEIMPVFHYALKPGGYLFLGPSENLGGFESHFDEVHASHKLFKRMEGPSKPLHMPLPGGRSQAKSSSAREGDALRKPAEEKADHFWNAIRDHHTPAFAAIDRNRSVSYTSGKIGRFIEWQPGVPKYDLIELAKEPLGGPLRQLLLGHGGAVGSVSYVDWNGEIDGEAMRLQLTVRSIDERVRLVIFEDRFEHQRADDNSVVEGATVVIDDTYVRSLEDDLESAQQTIRTTVEELETSNEELKSSNEEMMSMNEELQSANEELTTINDELQSKLRELDLAYADLDNFMTTAGVATIFLDTDLKVRSFTPEMKRYLRVVEQDKGRIISHIAGDLDMERLAALSQTVLDTGEGANDEQSTRDGNAEVQVAILPYQLEDKTVAGVVMTCVPVTELRRYARDLEVLQVESKRHLDEIEQLYKVSPQAMGLMGADMTYLRVNSGLAEINGISMEDHVGKTIYDLVPDLTDQVVEPVREVFRTGKPILAHQVTGETAADPGVERNWEVDWYPIHDGKQVSAVGVSVRDVTKYKEMEKELRRVMQELQHRVKNMLSNVVALINRAHQEEGEPKEILTTLVDRIHALGKTHNLLTLKNFSSVSFAQMLQTELVDVYGPDRINLRGPDLSIGAKSAVALGMAFHELATNAAKYGALSSPGGTLSINWSRIDEGDGEMLYVKWQELGGPPAPEPSRKGFGSRLINSTVAQSLQGTVNNTYDPAGFSAILTIPMAILDQHGDFNVEI